MANLAKPCITICNSKTDTWNQLNQTYKLNVCILLRVLGIEGFCMSTGYTPGNVWPIDLFTILIALGLCPS